MAAERDVGVRAVGLRAGWVLLASCAGTQGQPEPVVTLLSLCGAAHGSWLLFKEDLGSGCRFLSISLPQHGRTGHRGRDSQEGPQLSGESQQQREIPRVLRDSQGGSVGMGIPELN